MMWFLITILIKVKLPLAQRKFAENKAQDIPIKTVLADKKFFIRGNNIDDKRYKKI